MVGLQDKRWEYAENLSYGEQRRLEIARALALQPTLLLLDEPAAGLNPVETDRLMEILLKIKTLNKTILLIEHDMKLVMSISDWVTVLCFGKKIAEGFPSDISKNPEVMEAYLGSGALVSTGQEHAKQL